MNTLSRTPRSSASNQDVGVFQQSKEAAAKAFFLAHCPQSRNPLIDKFGKKQRLSRHESSEAILAYYDHYYDS
jgi:hypothetical protein